MGLPFPHIPPLGEEILSDLFQPPASAVTSSHTPETSGFPAPSKPSLTGEPPEGNPSTTPVSSPTSVSSSSMSITPIPSSNNESIVPSSPVDHSPDSDIGPSSQNSAISPTPSSSTSFSAKIASSSPMPVSFRSTVDPSTSTKDIESPSAQASLAGQQVGGHRNSHFVGIVVGSTFGGFIIIVCAIVVYYRVLKRRRNSRKFSILGFRTRRQSGTKNSLPGSSIEKIGDGERPNSGATRSIGDTVEPPADGGDSMFPRADATTENHKSQRQTASTSSSTEVFRDPSSGLPYLWAPSTHKAPSSTPSLSSSEIPWQLSVVHVHSNSSQESWSSSEEIAPLYSPVVL
ncbi:hypothetical protein NLI96_g10347 [Meripilus lineatus]|uniref:Mid2 domain-containing protein n=1 Tax=Meripilus lineatus TaxID=2056292 RepID=A0AAD5UW61_9APHY|nr:hypothetical protein NLI96_g10347 [Physisporinus lineatus]